MSKKCNLVWKQLYTTVGGKQTQLKKLINYLLQCIEGIYKNSDKLISFNWNYKELLIPNLLPNPKKGSKFMPKCRINSFQLVRYKPKVCDKFIKPFCHHNIPKLSWTALSKSLSPILYHRTCSFKIWLLLWCDFFK